MRFRSRPIEIEAIQWFENGDHPMDYKLTPQAEREYSVTLGKLEKWEGKIIRRYRHPGIPGNDLCEQCGAPYRVHGWIDNRGFRVCPGDWIITGVHGEFYPCSPAIFEKTYEKI